MSNTQPPDKHQRAHTPEETIRIILKGTIATVTGDTYPEIDEVDVKALLNLITRTNRESRIDELNYIQTHSSGGGSWRRIITQRIAALESQEVDHGR